MADPIGTVELNDSIFTLGTDLYSFGKLIEDGWGALATKTRESTDEFVDLTGGLLGTEWSGKTRDSFAEHRSNLVHDLDAIHSEMATQRDAATQILSLATSAQSRLEDSRDRLADLPTIRDGSVLRITVQTEAQMDTVNSVVAEAHSIKRDLHDQIGQAAVAFDTATFQDVDNRWTDFARDRSEPYDDGIRILPPLDTFVVPDREGTMVTHGFQASSSLFTTDTPIESVEVTQNNNGWYIVRFSDTTHYLEPGAGSIYIRSQGQTYEMNLITEPYETRLYA